MLGIFFYFQLKINQRKDLCLFFKVTVLAILKIDMGLAKNKNGINVDLFYVS